MDQSQSSLTRSQSPSSFMAQEFIMTRNAVSGIPLYAFRRRHAELFATYFASIINTAIIRRLYGMVVVFVSSETKEDEMC